MQCGCQQAGWAAQAPHDAARPTGVGSLRSRRGRSRACRTPSCLTRACRTLCSQCRSWVMESTLQCGGPFSLRLTFTLPP